MLGLILLIIALVLFALASFNFSSPRLNLLAAGLFCAFLSLVLGIAMPAFG